MQAEKSNDGDDALPERTATPQRPYPGSIARIFMDSVYKTPVRPMT